MPPVGTKAYLNSGKRKVSQNGRPTSSKQESDIKIERVLKPQTHRGVSHGQKMYPDVPVEHLGDVPAFTSADRQRQMLEEDEDDMKL